MDEITRYAWDLIECEKKDITIVLPLDGSMTYHDFLRLREVIAALDPDVKLTVATRRDLPSL